MLHQFDIRRNGAVEKMTVNLISETPKLMATLESNFPNLVNGVLARFEQFHPRNNPKEERVFRVDFFKKSPEGHFFVIRESGDSEENFKLLSINDAIEAIDSETNMYTLLCDIE